MCMCGQLRKVQLKIIRRLARKTSQDENSFEKDQPIENDAGKDQTRKT